MSDWKPYYECDVCSSDTPGCTCDWSAEFKALQSELAGVRAEMDRLQVLERCDHLLNQCAYGKGGAYDRGVADERTAVVAHLHLRFNNSDPSIAGVVNEIADGQHRAVQP